MTLNDAPCPCAIVAVATALSKAKQPSKKDRQVPYIIRFIRHLLSDLTSTGLDSIDWGECLLHKLTSEQILEILAERAAE